MQADRCSNLLSCRCMCALQECDKQPTAAFTPYTQQGSFAGMHRMVRFCLGMCSLQGSPSPLNLA